jgi:hypothetical protein
MNRGLWLLFGTVLTACKPDLAVQDWLVTSTRVLAVKSEPAEAKPGTSLTYTALIANLADGDSGSTISWYFCSAPKPPTEDNVVSDACLDSASLVPAGQGLSIVAATPSKACSNFGPNTPPGGFRPRDPDATGGYYQPLGVDVPGSDTTFHLERILCTIADAPFDIAAEFSNVYVANSNPHLAPLSATIGGQVATLNRVPVGAHVALEVSWSAADAESFAYFDRASQTISTERESMRIAWYTSAGTLDTETTGRAADDLALYSDNTWTAPSQPGSVKLWVVLRDSRGGVDWAIVDVIVSL